MTLDFGLLLMPSAPRGERFEDGVRRCIAEAQAAERAGFGFCMVPEHHQDRGYIPQPLLVAAAVAASTNRIRIGTAIAIVGLKHPLHVLEEFYSLDVISAGRAITGVGLGYMPKDFSMFGRDIDDRVSLFEDALEVLARARGAETISYHGAHAAFDDVHVVPRPTQPQGPPVWIGAWSLPGGRRAGRLADGLFVDQHVTPERAERLLRVYREAAEASGRSASVVLNRYAAVGDTREHARAVLEPHVMKTLRYYFRNEAHHDAPAWKAAGRAEDLRFDDFSDGFVFGTADDCADQLRVWQQRNGVDRVMLLLRTASGPSHEVVLEQIERFGRDVIPQFKPPERRTEAA